MTQIISLPLRCTQIRIEKWSSSLELHGFAPSSRCLCRCRVTTPTAPSAPRSYSEPSLTTLRVQSTLLGRKHGLLLTHFVFRPKSYPTSCFSGATFSQASRSLLQSQESRFCTLPCLVPVRLSPRPSRSIDFGDVSQTNGPE